MDNPTTTLTHQDELNDDHHHNRGDEVSTLMMIMAGEDVGEDVPPANEMGVDSHPLVAAAAATTGGYHIAGVQLGDDDNHRQLQQQLHLQEEEEEERDNTDEERPSKRAKCIGGASQRKRYSNHVKLQVLAALNNGDSRNTVSQVSRDFNIAASCVRRWKKEATTIHNAVLKTSRGTSKCSRPHDPLSKLSQILTELYDWNNEQIQRNNYSNNNNNTAPLNLSSPPVLVPIALRIKDLLLQYHTQQNPYLSPKELTALQTFTASISWAKKFVRTRQWNTTSSKALLSSASVAATGAGTTPTASASISTSTSAADNKKNAKRQLKYAQQYTARMEEIRNIAKDYHPSNVYMMDEMTLFYKTLTGTAASLPHHHQQHHQQQQQQQQQHFLGAKDRISLIVCANEDGSDKVPISVVSNDKKSDHECFVHARQVVLPLYYNDSNGAPSSSKKYKKNWWNMFLAHIRSTTRTCNNNGGSSSSAPKVLLLISQLQYSNTFIDPLLQVRVEWIPATPPRIMPSPVPVPVATTFDADADNNNNTYATASRTTVYDYYDSNSRGGCLNSSSRKNHQGTPAPCHPMRDHEVGIVSRLKRYYRCVYLLQVLQLYGELSTRRRAAQTAQMPIATQGLEEGQIPHLRNAMTLLLALWDNMDSNFLSQAWYRAGIRGGGCGSSTTAYNNPSTAAACAGGDAAVDEFASCTTTTGRTKKIGGKGITAASGSFRDVEGMNLMQQLLTELSAFEEKKKSDGDDETIGNEDEDSTPNALDVCLSDLYRALADIPSGRNINKNGAIKRLLEEWIYIEEKKEILEMLQQESQPDQNFDEMVEQLVRRVVASTSSSSSAAATASVEPRSTGDESSQHQQQEDNPPNNIGLPSGAAESPEESTTSVVDREDIQKHIHSLLAASAHFSQLTSPEYRDVAVTLRECVEQVRQAVRQEEQEQEEEEEEEHQAEEPPVNDDHTIHSDNGIENDENFEATSYAL